MFTVGSPGKGRRRNRKSNSKRNIPFDTVRPFVHSNLIKNLKPVHEQVVRRNPAAPRPPPALWVMVRCSAPFFTGSEKTPRLDSLHMLCVYYGISACLEQDLHSFTEGPGQWDLKTGQLWVQGHMGNSSGDSGEELHLTSDC